MIVIGHDVSFGVNKVDAADVNAVAASGVDELNFQVGRLMEEHFARHCADVVRLYTEFFDAIGDIVGAHLGP